MRKETAVIERPVFGLTRVKQVGIKCPKCGAFTHAYYDGPELERHLRRLREMEDLLRQHGDLNRVQREYRVAKTRFKTEFNRYQQGLAKRLVQLAKKKANRSRPPKAISKDEVWRMRHLSSKGQKKQ
jgi:hypothetical protein